MKIKMNCDVFGKLCKEETRVCFHNVKLKYKCIIKTQELKLPLEALLFLLEVSEPLVIRMM